MTNEEAINSLANFKRYISGGGLVDRKANEAIDMAIKALEQQPCEDAISRAEVINEIDRYIDKAQSTGTRDHFISFQELVVKQLPSVTPQQETGKWIKEGEEKDVVGFRWTSRRCSKCGWTHCLVIPNNYCPNCGAKMEVEE